MVAMFSCDQQKGASTDQWNESLVIGGAFKYQEKKIPWRCFTILKEHVGGNSVLFSIL